MKAGFCEADITPEIGMEWPGGYGKAYVKSIRDPLKVRAAVFDDGAERVAFAGLDTLTIQSRRAVAEIREGVERATGIPGDHVMLAASHTHMGGPFHGPLPSDFKDAPPLVRDLLANHTTIADPIYCERVIRQTSAAIVEADRRREKARLSAGSGIEDQVAFNRRFRMKSGRAYTHPGKGNPDILEPAGPMDPEVGVLAAWNTSGDLLGCVVNYACHGTTMGGGASPDWIYYLAKTIKDTMGQRVVPVFLNGACGDVTQVDNLSLREAEFGERWGRLVGTRVGAEALKVLVTAQPGDLAPVAAASATLTIKRRAPSKTRIEQSVALVEKGLASGEKNTDWTFAKELVILDYLVHKEPEAQVEVQAIQVGPAIFLSTPAEYFCQYGLDIKKGSSFPFTYVVELANGCVGYVPTEDAFSPSGGGYETVLTSYSNLRKEAGTMIARACLELANRFQAGSVPQPPKARTPSEKADAAEYTWDYGVLGPDLE